MPSVDRPAERSIVAFFLALTMERARFAVKIGETLAGIGALHQRCRLGEVAGCVEIATGGEGSVALACCEGGFLEGLGREPLLKSTTTDRAQAAGLAEQRLGAGVVERRCGRGSGLGEPRDLRVVGAKDADLVDEPEMVVDEPLEEAAELTGVGWGLAQSRQRGTNRSVERAEALLRILLGQQLAEHGFDPAGTFCGARSLLLLGVPDLVEPAECLAMDVRQEAGQEVPVLGNRRIEGDQEPTAKRLDVEPVGGGEAGGLEDRVGGALGVETQLGKALVGEAETAEQLLGRQARAQDGVRVVVVGKGGEMRLDQRGQLARASPGGAVEVREDSIEHLAERQRDSGQCCEPVRTGQKRADADDGEPGPGTACFEDRHRPRPPAGGLWAHLQVGKRRPDAQGGRPAPVEAGSSRLLSSSYRRGSRGRAREASGV